MNSKLICDAFVYIFEAILLWFYCESLFICRLRRMASFLIVFFLYGGLFLLFQIGNPLLNALANILVIFLVIKYLYYEKLVKSMVHTFLYYLFLIGAEFVVMPVLAIILNTEFFSYQNNEAYYILSSVISKIIHLLCCIIVIILYQRIKNHDNGKGYAITLIIPITNIIVLVLIAFTIKDTPLDKTMYNTWTISAVLILVSSLLVFYNRSYLIRQSEKINELNIENQSKKMNEQFFEVIEKNNESMQILAHDFKNHLSQINSFTEISDVNDYINRIYPDVEVFISTGVSDNRALDLIISKYISLCDFKNIKFVFDVHLCNLSQIDNVDLSSLLNNLLDNAMDAANKSSNKTIEFETSHFTPYYDQILVKNSCDEKPRHNNRSLVTNKTDKLTHGIGLKSVKKIVEKYNGMYNWEYDEKEKEFITIITIPR